jgi:VanZ family protein
MRPPELRRSAGVSPRLRFAARLALVVELICIAWLASYGQLQQMQVQSILMFDDKSTHVLAFFVTGLTASLASRSPAISAIALAAMAGGVEILQLFVPGRTASILDFAASLAGVASGLGLGALLWPRLLEPRRSN